MNKSTSYWLLTSKQDPFPKLKKDILTDALIIGGGITGMHAALALQEAGLSTTLIEQHRIGHGTTAYTTAKITYGHHLIYDDIKKTKSKDLAYLYGQANLYGLQYIEKLVTSQGIDCGFETLPHILYATASDYERRIQREFEVCQDIGLSVQYKENAGLPFKTYGTIVYEDQAQFHPLKYLYHLSQLYKEKGGTIFEGTKAKDIDFKNLTVTTEEGSIKAKSIVIATHYPCFDQGHLYFLKMFPYTSYILALRGTKKLKSLPMGLSVQPNVRSFRHVLTDNGPLLLMGGSSHPTGTSFHPHRHISALKRYSKQLDHPLNHHLTWGTMDYITSDRIPFIGKLSESIDNCYVATGFSKWGMTHSAFAGKLLKELICQGRSDYTELYSPNRHAGRRAIFYSASKMLDNSYTYIRSLLRHDQLSKIQDLKEGDACIIRIHNQRVGIYKEKNGQLFALDTACPHLGCSLEYNTVTHTWDCPCHGSRFKYNGAYLDGPANRSMRKLSLEEFQGLQYPEQP